LASPSNTEANELRQNFLDLAYFNPGLTLSDDGHGQASFKLPDNLTTFKIYVIATCNGAKTGPGQSQVLVTKDLLLRSSLPSYASIGDTFSAGIILTNRSDLDGTAKVSFSAENIEILNSEAGLALTKEVTIPAGQSREILFPVKANIFGKSIFNFKAVMADLTDEVRYSLNVIPVNKLTTQASYLQLDPGQISIPLNIKDSVDPDRGGLSIELSPSLIGVFKSPFQWLDTYPYECLEQKTSKAFGALLRLNLMGHFADDHDTIDKNTKTIESHIAYLQRVVHNGGFSYWPDQQYSGYNYPTLTTYVLEFLLTAKDNGFNVPDSLTSDIVNFLYQYIGDPQRYDPSWLSPIFSRTNRLYAISVLSRTPNFPRSFIDESLEIALNPDPRLVDSLELVDILFITRAVYALPPSADRTEILVNLIRKIYNELEITAGSARVVSKDIQYNPMLWFNSDKLNALVALTVSEVAPYGQQMPLLIRELALRASSGHFSTTQSSVLSLWAITNYLKSTEFNDPNIKVDVALGDENVLTSNFDSFVDPISQTFIPIKDVINQSQISLNAQGTGQVWSSVKLSQSPLAPDLSSAYSTAFILSREYSIVSSGDSQPSQTTFARGDVVKVSITMMSPNDRHDIVIEDKVPAGFEPINFNLDSTDQLLAALLAPSTDDNRRFWYTHQQIRPDSVAVFAEYIRPGVYTYSYLVRAATPGTYQIPGPSAEEMYQPESFSRASGTIITISE
jgi:uncharacterized protein YfaS (alpha-2-macroglobulin family)